MIVIIKWNRFKPGNKTWMELKLHFTEAYIIKCRQTEESCTPLTAKVTMQQNTTAQIV